MQIPADPLGEANTDKLESKDMKRHQTKGPSELFSLVGKTALVTGASSGLGARFACLLAAAGAEVVAVARREKLLDELSSQNPRISALAADVSTPTGRERIQDHLRSRDIRVDVVVNNAGISGKLSAAEESADDFTQVLSVNLVSSYSVLRDIVEINGDGSSVNIINVSSILGIVAGSPVGGAGYAASKAGLIGLTRELAGQWGHLGIRVNALAPGWFPSEMTTELLADPQSARWIQRNTMLRRPGREDELDSALLFLASPSSSYMTGQVLVVDGGWTAR